MESDEDVCPNCKGTGKIVRCICTTKVETFADGGAAYSFVRNPKCRADHTPRLMK